MSFPSIMTRDCRRSAMALFCSRLSCASARMMPRLSCDSSMGVKVKAFLSVMMMFSFARYCAICIISVDWLDVHCASS